MLGSVCSGVGCIDLGLEQAGFQPAWQCEINPLRRSVLARHWPGVSLYEDLSEIADAAGLAPVDLIAGGTPCQDFSVAGRGQGLDGERSGLFYDLVRLADSQPAAWILWENVPGVLSITAGRDFAVCLEGFIGYRPGLPLNGWRGTGFAVGPLRWCCWRVLDAQHFGCAQRRRRLFLVAGPRTRCAPEVLLEPESLPGGSPARLEAGAVSSTLTSGGVGGYRLDDGEIGQLVTSPLTQITSPENRANPLHTEGATGGVPFVFQETGTGFATGASLRSSGGSGGGVSQAVTLDGVRRLTPREYERLQGMPDDWTRWDCDGTELADTPRCQALGDGAARPVIEWIGHRLRRAMGA
jgi:DNA (cytosine-5)-methyltransferase 1